MGKMVFSSVVLCSAILVQAGVIDLGSWTGDKSYSMSLAGESSGGTPVYSSSYCDLFSDHILLNKWTYSSMVQYKFTADSAIIDSVTLDLDQYQWDPESSSGNTLYINVNGTVVQRVDLPASSQIGSVGPATINFDSPVDIVVVSIQRYLRWGGDNQGNLNIYESPNLGNTPWVFHAVPEPASLGFLGMGLVFIRRKYSN